MKDELHPFLVPADGAVPDRLWKIEALLRLSHAALGRDFAAGRGDVQIVVESMFEIECAAEMVAQIRARPPE